MVHYLLALIEHSFFSIGAVITFFVISGIVIHFPYRFGKPLNIKEFYVKRNLRICIPMLLVALVAFYFNISASEMPFGVYIVN